VLRLGVVVQPPFFDHDLPAVEQGRDGFEAGGVIWSEREVSLMASSLLAAPTSGFENDSGKV
jgi:hypothetical protein